MMGVNQSCWQYENSCSSALRISLWGKGVRCQVSGVSVQVSGLAISDTLRLNSVTNNLDLHPGMIRAHNLCENV